ncbi:MAG: T9SS type A sorting domain-containing protein [Flavobacteriales bacterium]|nr:T9SS type A sorting domain-containing protein [Flavobacteriales bacterium]
MKTIVAFILFSISSLPIFAQGTIVSLSVMPENPTVNDDIEIYAEVMFTSSDCLIDNQAHSVNGFNIGASAHHCVGMLTALCNRTDVFEVGQLAAGTYTFDMTLTSGFGGAGCTAGIVPDDNDQLTFTVSSSVGIDESDLEHQFVYPNPTSGLLQFRTQLDQTVFITDLSGKKVMEIPSGASYTDISALQTGMYLLRISGRQIPILKQ